jgi:rSAM/selenodomain-associated transferase 2/rSAM/selenodomain-associated transferase 1
MWIVRFFGGDEQQFREQFGTQPTYAPQADGTLGDRINSAVAAAFQDGAERVVVIGTDCPLLGESRLTTAIEPLANHDVVIGPATDAGYYLIGMRKHLPSLFENITWGTESVLQQTLTQAKAISASLKKLAAISDVDYVEDLTHCRQVEGSFCEVLPKITTGRISIIIPTWNEADNITHTLQQLGNISDVEIIVADGGSTDNTVELAQTAGAHVINCNAGRGKQMNAGAALASGEVLLFLHADTQLPDDFSEHIWRAMNSENTGGAFRLRIDAQGWMLRVIEFGANLRSRWLHLPYGDQAIFVRASAFFQMNGFQQWPLMEDFDFCRRLKQIGKMTITPVAVTTSARRWKRLGVLRTTLTNFACVIAFHCGVSPATLARWYRRR